MSESLPPNSPSDLTAASGAYPTDVLMVDQLNPDGHTYTTRGVLAEMLVNMLVSLLVPGSWTPANANVSQAFIILPGTTTQLTLAQLAAEIVSGPVTSVAGAGGVVTAAQISAALDTVADDLTANGITPGAATPCTAKVNIFTTVAAGGYAILTNTTIGAVTEVVNRGANPELLLPPEGWQFENFGINEPIEVAIGTPAGGSVKIVNGTGDVCRVLS
jgi:hypothetical protein